MSKKLSTKSYGLLEKQFKNLVQSVQNKKGDTGELIISKLETRLDNLVYRLGFAKSRVSARQLVSHSYFLINGRPVNIPSYQVKKDDVVVSYCTSGMEASMNWYILYNYFGFKNVKLYDASMREWGNREDTPMERFKWEMFSK